jgi:hypothetical protein
MEELAVFKGREDNLQPELEMSFSYVVSCGRVIGSVDLVKVIKVSRSKNNGQPDERGG